MKRMIVLLSVISVVVGCLHSQDQYLWMRLSENRAMTNALFQSLSGDSLVVLRGGRRVSVPLQEIVQIRLIRESSILEGAAIGSGVGLAVGGAVGFSLRAADKSGSSPLRTALMFGVMGAIVGSLSAALDHPDAIVHLAGMTVAEKRKMIETIVTKNQDEVR